MTKLACITSHDLFIDITIIIFTLITRVYLMNQTHPDEGYPEILHIYLV